MIDRNRSETEVKRQNIVGYEFWKMGTCVDCDANWVNDQGARAPGLLVHELLRGLRASRDIVSLLSPEHDTSFKGMASCCARSL
jgi:hypothetical protein